MSALLPTRAAGAATRPGRPDGVSLVWSGFVLAALLLLPAVPLALWAVLVPVAAAIVLVVTGPSRVAASRSGPDRLDVAAIAVLYVAVVGLFRVAFGVFTTEAVAGLFLAFAGGLVLGVAGPVVYTTWIRGRPLATLGLGLHRLRPTLALAALFGGTQLLVLFWGYRLPAAVDWVPLLVLSLTVGLFEAVFFRGFVQGRLEAAYGTPVGVAGAAALYSLYHVGYGMGAGEMVFLFGLGVVYAIAYRLVENIFVLWPLLTPVGAFFNNLEAGDIDLPWASIAGFADVLAVMAAIVWLAARHQRRSAQSTSHPTIDKEEERT